MMKTLHCSAGYDAWRWFGGSKQKNKFDGKGMDECIVSYYCFDVY